MKGQGFVAAGKLSMGDEIMNASGGSYPVECVELEEKQEVVYTFQVEDYHMYYVGENSIPVHNDCENPVIDNMESRVPDSEVEIPNKRGNAPTSKKDGKPIEIHHDEQNPNGPFKEMHSSDHR